jgi:hypothetical protein
VSVSSVDGQCILVRFCDTNPPFSCLPQDFGRWLRTHDEFDYIVDGANVAYNAQNYDDGRFTFKQVSKHYCTSRATDCKSCTCDSSDPSRRRTRCRSRW